jgi:hypothetical protein
MVVVAAGMSAASDMTKASDSQIAELSTAVHAFYLFNLIFELKLNLQNLN